MKLTFIAILILLSYNLAGKIKPNIYFFPGQGSDRHIFDSLKIDTNYRTIIVEYGSPSKHQGMNAFAKQLSRQIDTTQEFILVGVSLGGMICVELNEILNPHKTIIISSVKNRNELPFRYKFQKTIPIYRLLPGSILLTGAKILQPIVEPDRNKNKKTFKSMLRKKKPSYIKRTIDLIIKWDRTENTKPIYHIHGNKDHTLPIKKLKSVTNIVENGSHMMTLTRANDISAILNSILTEC